MTMREIDALLNAATNRNTSAARLQAGLHGVELKGNSEDSGRKELTDKQRAAIKSYKKANDGNK